MNPLRRPFLAFAVLLLIVLIYGFWPKAGEGKSRSTTENPRSSSARRSSIANEQASSETAETVARTASAARLIALSQERFLASSGAAESKTILDQLRDGLRSTDDPQAAAAAIAGYLKTGKDASTHLPFVVGPEGVMDVSPTLRTALLDLLAELDPSLALDLARSIMDEMRSPDEYAIALRNLAWNDLNGDLTNELNERFNQLVTSKSWLEHPSAGFLEALDVGVELANKQSFELLLSANNQSVTNKNTDLSRASFLAMDRLVVHNPSVLVDAFQTDPTLNGLTTDQRASLMSRLNITDSKQRETFVRYLFTSSHDNAEMDYFARLFPNGNSIYGNWLITTSDPSQTIAARQEADRAVLAEIEKLSATTNDTAAQATLEKIRNRLAKFVHPN